MSNNGLQLLSRLGRHPDDRGVVLLVAVALDVWQKNQGRVSLTGMAFRYLKAKGTSPTGSAPNEDSAAHGRAVDPTDLLDKEAAR